MTVISVYATFASLEEAERIGRQVVEEQLAACINIFPGVRSIYQWKGTVESSEEVAAILKTSDSRAADLITRIAGLHSYAVPCIVSSPVDKILASYADWIEDSTR